MNGLQKFISFTMTVDAILRLESERKDYRNNKKTVSPSLCETSTLTPEAVSSCVVQTPT